MKTMKQFIVMLLSIWFCMPLAYAQTAPDNQQDVLIIIQQEQVRFTAQRAVEEMRLQIFDQAGQPVYDSGAVTGPELSWVLRQADGEAVKGGLYAYTLSVKESGAADARLRRGHFIVDPSKERDGKTDRLWITSQNDGSVGTALTVARSDGEGFGANGGVIQPQLCDMECAQSCSLDCADLPGPLRIQCLRQCLRSCGCAVGSR
jgi:hypothetical protein